MGMDEDVAVEKHEHRMSGLWLFILGNTQFIVTLLTAMTLLRLRSAHAVYFGAGTLVASFSAKIAKRFIRQPRPVGAKKYEKTYGMPSTHSCSIAFFGTYLTLASLLLPFHPRLLSLLPAPANWFKHDAVTTAIRFSLAALWITAAASVCWSRVKLGHHTPAQVIVGASLGALIAFAWLALWLGTLRLTTLRYSPSTTTGLHLYGPIWERAGEDAVFAMLEAYEKRDWRPLRALLSFPLPHLTPRDSL